MYRHWTEFRADEFREIDSERTIAILPTAAVEQHGPHLPVGTDTIIGMGMLSEVATRLPTEIDARILPFQAIGKSNEHIWELGTLSLRVESALATWLDVGQSVSRSGVRKIVIVNSHGGNLDMVSILARELRVRYGMIAVKCQWGSFGYPKGMFSAQERQFGIHGGDVETSLMLHFRPDLVSMERAQNFVSSAETDEIQPTGPVSYGWIAKDLNSAGTVGNASVATRSKGEATAAHQANGFVELLHQVSRKSLAGIVPSNCPE